MPATRATASTSPLLMAPPAMSDAVSGRISTLQRATARRCVASFGVTSTIRARPNGSRWVRRSGMNRKCRSQPPIWLMLLAGLTKVTWPMR